MVKVEPKIYRKYGTINRKRNLILYVKMHKSLYGLFRSTLVFYKKLFNGLKVYGFVINPYNHCVAKMEVNGYQLTVIWNVEILKVSHKDPFEVTRLVGYQNDIYGGLKVYYGEVHDYLGIYLDSSKELIVKV